MTKVTILKRSQRAFKGWTGHYRKRIDTLEAALEHIARHFGSAEQCRELAQAALEEHKHGD